MDDHRCLYGHRVPADFSFAIENDACPKCGAPLISISGYELARGLATSVPLEAVQAFATVRFLEKNYVLSPRSPETDPEGEEQPVVEPPPEAPVTMAVAPIAEVASPKAELKEDPEETEEVDLDDVSVEEPVDLRQVVNGNGTVAPIVLTEIPARDEESMDDVEKSFFQ